MENQVVPDRLGTNRAYGARFYPYGDEITSTSNDREKFATYTRDSYSGLDYADQRFYASSYGRFNTPDPAGARAASPSDPGTLNRYSYVAGDPINRLDSQGLYYQWADPESPEQGIWGDLSGGGGCDSILDSIDGFVDTSVDPCSTYSGPVFFRPPQQAGGGGGGGAAAPTPTCAAANGVPDSVELPQLVVLLGENSWGLYPSSAVAKEDLYMGQAMYNYAAPKGFASSSARVDATINTDKYRGYPHGMDVLGTDLTSTATSAFCQDLTTAENAYATFWNGSQSFSNVNQWRTATGTVGAGQTQIAGTVFFNNPSAFYSPTRPVRRPTPPIKLPAGITGR